MKIRICMKKVYPLHTVSGIQIGEGGMIQFAP
jgi:hypothetical protein